MRSFQSLRRLLALALTTCVYSLVGSTASAEVCRTSIQNFVIAESLSDPQQRLIVYVFDWTFSTEMQEPPSGSLSGHLARPNRPQAQSSSICKEQFECENQRHVHLSRHAEVTAGKHDGQICTKTAAGNVRAALVAKVSRAPSATTVSSQHVVTACSSGCKKREFYHGNE